jgi:hypothetical protein
VTTEDLATADETRQFRPAGSAFAARRAAARAFRPRRVLPAIIVAALLAVAAGLIAAYLISKYVGHQVHVLPSGLFQAGHQLHWDDQRSLIAAAVACALGLLLIGYAVLPGRFRVVPVDSQDPLSVTAVTRAGLRRYLAGAAATVDGIASAKVRVRRRRFACTPPRRCATPQAWPRRSRPRSPSGFPRCRRCDRCGFAPPSRRRRTEP